MKDNHIAKLKNKDLKIAINHQGEISSIKFKNQEILHQGQKWWFKTYPIIWPNISFSNHFVVDGKNYQLPKHGFWKQLTWKHFYENHKLVLVATHLDNQKYPFKIDIQHQFSLENNKLIIETLFSNLSSKTAYFSFGHHPAFQIDQNTFIEQKGQLTYIDDKGKHHQQVKKMEPVLKMPFGQGIDTYAFKNLKMIDASFISNNLKINLQTDDFSTLLIWRPPTAQFICVEPMQGWGDDEYQAPPEAQNKQDIISLKSGKTKSFKLTISVQADSKKTIA